MYFVVNQDILLVTSCVNMTKRPNNYKTKENLLYMFIHIAQNNHFMAIIHVHLHCSHPMLRTGGFCWSKVLLPASPC